MLRRSACGLALLALVSSSAVAVAAPLSTRFSMGVGSGPVGSLAVEGNRLYVGSGSSLYVLDISGSGTPQVLGQLALGGRVTAVHAQGTTVYAGTEAQSGAELRVINASTPSSPTQAGALELGIMVTSIVSQGTTLYVGAASPDGENPANGLRVVSVATPSNPTQLMETLANTRVFGLKVYGNRLLGASNPVPSDISVIQVWNITNPQSPQRVAGTAAGRTVRAYWVDVAGQYAFAGQYHGQEDRELGVFDLSALPALSSPTAVGFSSRSFAGAISGSYLFAGLEARAPTNLEVVDVSHGPTALRLEGFTAGSGGRVNAVAVAGTTVFLGFDTGSNNLLGVDVSKYLGPDTTPPTVALQQPVGGAPLSGRIGLAAVATDDIRVTQVDFAVDGAPIGTARNQSLTAPFVITWDTAGVSDGPHTVTATARDNGGNATTSTITVTVANAAGDQLPPTVSLINPRPADKVAHALLLSASAEDNFAVTQVRYRIDGVDFGVPVTAAPWRAVLDSTQLSDGTHSLVAVATDAAGNAATSTPVSFTVDNRPTWYSAFTPTREVYVSPSGTGNGSSAASPTSLASAVASAQPGDLVWLAAGTYPTPLPDLTRAGTSARPIVWRAQAGARAILPGELLVRAAHNWVWGLELYGLSMQAANTRAINNTVRVGLGITPWDAGPGMVIYGNIIFEDASTGLAMHNIYTQNDFERDGYKYFIRNVSLESSTMGCSSNSQNCYSFHAYSTTATVTGFYLQENVFAFDRFLVGGYGIPTDRVVLKNNYLYRSDMQLGYARPTQVEARGNYCGRSGLKYEWVWGAGEVRYVQRAPTLMYDNTFFGSGDVLEVATSAYLADDRSEGTQPFSPTDHFDDNVYASPFRAVLEANGQSSTSTSLTAWQNATAAAGRRFDQNSTLAPFPTTAKVVVLPNDYERQRATVVIYNWGLAANVSVDLSGVFAPGPYTVLPVRGLFGTPVATGTLASSPVSLPTGGAEFVVYVVRGTPAGTTQQPPSAVLTCTPQTGPAPITVVCDCAASSDADGTIASCHFSLDGGAETTGPTASYTFSTPGTHTVALRVVDDDGLQGSAQTGLTVTGPAANQPPVALAGATPTSGLAPLTVAFSSTGSSDPEGTALSFSWNFGDGTPPSTAASPSHTYTTPGSYTATLTVTDSGTPPASATATVTITVTTQAVNQPPVARAQATPTSGEAPLTVAFSSAGSSDPEGTALSFSWDFGDGSPASTAASPAHVYSAPGSYTATLTVTDAGNPPASSTATVTVTVAAGANHPPDVSGVTVSPLVARPGDVIAFDASSVTDPDGDAVTMSWDFGDTATSTDAVTTHVYAAAGVFTVRLSAQDDGSPAIGPAVREFEVRITGNRPPDCDGATVTPLEGEAPLAARLDAAGCTDADRDPLSFRWTLTAPDGSSRIINQAASDVTLTQVGAHAVTLEAWDDAAVPLRVTRDFTVTVRAASTQADGGVAGDGGVGDGAMADAVEGSCGCSGVNPAQTTLLALGLLAFVRRRRTAR